MIISDLLEKKERGLFTDDVILKADLIALDGKDGKVLFDTSRNKREHISKYANGEILSLWADVRRVESVYGGYIKPVIKCYVSHDSWKRSGDYAHDSTDGNMITRERVLEIVNEEAGAYCDYLVRTLDGTSDYQRHVSAVASNIRERIEAE